MPNRIIKDSINESRGLSEVSFFADDLYKRLITYADDYGRFNADFQILRARLYPREIEIVSDQDIEDAMTELAGVGKIAFFTSTAKKEIYGCFPNWGDHQRLRESKAKTPDPDNTDVNDWYLRRFISLDMKIRILERDKYKCQECGKYICADVESPKKLIKMGTGLFHFDHIVPVQQGGRATEENLRLLCPKCNLSRKKVFSADEILKFTRQAAATRRETRPESESNPNTNPNPSVNLNAPAQARSTHAKASVTVVKDEDDEGFDAFWSAYPRKTGDIRQAYLAYVHALDVGATPERIIDALTWQAEEWQEEGEAQFIPSPEKWLTNRRWEEQRRKKKQPKSLAAELTPVGTVDMAALTKTLDNI